MEDVADHTSRFDREVERLSKMPYSRTIEEGLKRSPGQVATAAIATTDTLSLAWYGAQHVFGKAAKPEHAFQLLGLTLSTLDKMPEVEAEADPEFYQMVQEREADWKVADQAQREALGAPQKAAPPPPPVQTYFEPPADWGKTSNNPG